METEAAGAVSSSMAEAVLRVVERAGGVDLVERVARRAGLDPATVPRGTDGWIPLTDLLALADAAEALCDVPALGRRMGAELLRLGCHEGLDAPIRAEGGPGPALEWTVAFGNRLFAGQLGEVVAGDDRSLTVELRSTAPELVNPFWCAMCAGAYEQVPALFGVEAIATESTCRSRGDDVCTVTIRWDDDATTTAAQAKEAADLVFRRVGWFEDMQKVTGQITRAPDLETLLQRIVEAANHVVIVPAIVVALRVDEHDAPLVAARGVDPGEAAGLAAELLDGTYDGRFGIPAVGPLGDSGVVAALFPPGPALRDTDHRLITAFAGQATAALETFEAGQQAERREEEATALLALARSLADCSDNAEVADRLARAIPTVTGASTSTVLRWDATTNALVPAAFSGPMRELSYERLTLDEIPELAEFVGQPEPVVLGLDDAPARIGQLMVASAEHHLAIVPVTARGSLLAILSVGYTGAIPFNQSEVFRRLQGAADLAATAFEKADLLEQIRHQALHDALTGLPNRPLLADRVEQALTRARRDDEPLAMLFIDLDGFKDVNDSLGHHAGDELIRQVGERLRSSLRASDTVARTGGDEFVVLLPEVDGPTGATEAARGLLQALEGPFEVAGHRVHASASIGVATFPEDGNDYDGLLQHADSAMYDAKARGRGKISSSGGPRLLGRLDLEADLRAALERDELLVLFQPQYELASMRVIGAECLVRWHHPRRHLLGPGHFLDVAEEVGLMPEVDRVVRRMALAQARRWSDAGIPLRVAVNLSTADALRVDIIDEVAGEIDAAGVDPGSVEIEITDRIVAERTALRQLVLGFRACGMRVAVDDFGTGTSVLARLQELPVHTLKIDKSLVEPLAVDAEAPVVSAVVRMAHDLGMVVVAEGVEHPEQAGALGRSGCDLAQGFLFSAPVPAPELTATLRTDRRTA